MELFQQELEIIDGNPYVKIPQSILKKLFLDANRDRSPIPIHGTINGKPFIQTLLRYKGDWRLYVNMIMLSDSPRRIGERIDVEVAFDPRDRSIVPHPLLIAALNQNQKAKTVFEGLSASRQKEIVRYINQLKTKKSVEKNVRRAILFLTGQGRFVGRDAP